MEYRYVRWNTGTGEIEFLPRVLVYVRIDGHEIPLHGLVDSGAYTCLISKELAPDFGIDLSTCQKTNVSGIGGKGQVAYVTTAKIKMIDFDGYEFETPIIFADTPSSLLLGQADFFTNFKVVFEKQKGTFSLHPVPHLKE